MSGGLYQLMDNVIQFGGAGSLPYTAPGDLPDMTVIELAIITALLRKGPGTVAVIAPLLSEWFKIPIDPSQLAGPINRMVAMHWLVVGPESFLMPAPAALEPTTLLYPGFIRMFGDSLEPAAPGEVPELREDEPWSDHDEP
jgi:hypothetical protein